MKKNYIHKSIYKLILTAMLCLVFSTAVQASEWKQTNGSWWYQNDDGSFPTGGFAHIDGQWYYFDENGYMCTGWVQDVNGAYYFMDTATGAMLTNTMTPDGKYYLGADGKLADSPQNTASYEAASTVSAERNVLRATVDGVPKIFYLTGTGGTVGGDVSFSTWSVNADGSLGETIHLNIPKKTSPGTVYDSSNKKAQGFSLRYKPSYNETQYNARTGKGSYTCTVTVNESDGAHMAGTFSAVAKKLTGGGTVTITDGSFDLYKGEKVQWVRDLWHEAYVAEHGSSSSSSAYSDYDDYDIDYSSGSSSSSKIDHTCRTCRGSGECTGCAGRGWKTRSDGKVWDCPRCRGTGRCQVCYGTGSVY